MLADYSILLISAILVNNFVLVQFLGLCPFMGVSNKLETAMGMSMATTFVLTLASACSNLTYHFLLQPLGLDYLRTIAFILVIAVVVQFTEMVVRKSSPLLHRVLAAMRERLTVADVPTPFKGAAIGMVTAGLMSLAFMGFAGLV